MAVGTPLSELRRMLRSEVGQSLNPAQGVNAQGQYDMALDRTQKELWEQYEWPHLKYYADLPAMMGQRMYPYPEKMRFDAIIRGYAASSLNSNWQPLDYGISLDDYGGDETAMGWPIQKWQNVPTFTGAVTNAVGQMELWPIPNQNGSVRFEGQALCNNFVADADRAVLDDTLITLFAAAEILAAQKAENAALKLQKANQFLRRLLANQGAMKRRIIALGGYGSTPGASRQTPYIDYIPMS